MHNIYFIVHSSFRVEFQGPKTHDLCELLNGGGFIIIRSAVVPYRVMFNYRWLLWSLNAQTYCFMQCDSAMLY